MMIEIIVHALLGLILGIMTGLLPGIGPSVILLGGWTILMQSNLASLLTFYFMLLCTSQYFGSVSAIIYGVMGEITSAPAVKYGHAMANRGRGLYALRYTAYSSFIASIIAIFGSAVTLMHYPLLQTFLTGNMRIVVITMLFSMLVVTNSQRLLTLLLIAVGVIAGIVGYNSILQRHLIVNDYSGLDGGIPFIPMMVGLLVIPVLIKGIRSVNPELTSNYKPSNKPHSLIPDWSMIRGSITGFFVGIIPGISYQLSSNFAAVLEKKINKYSRIRPLIAAEAANNAASISAMLPMLIFALPVVPSEVLLLSLAETSGYTANKAMAFIFQHWWQISFALFVANIVSLMLARISYARLHLYYANNQNLIYLWLMIGIVYITIFYGGKYDNLTITIMTLFIGSVLGAIIKNFEAKAAGLIGFMLSEQYLSDIYRQLLLQGMF